MSESITIFQDIEYQEGKLIYDPVSKLAVETR